MKLQETKWTKNLHELIFYNDEHICYKLLVYDYKVSRIMIVRLDKKDNSYDILYKNKLTDKSYKFCKKLYKAIIREEMTNKQLNEQYILLKE